MSKIETMYSTIIDRNGRVIDIGYDGTDVIAEHGGKEVGRFGLSEEDVEDGHPSKYILYHCEINAEFRNCGISTIMFNACEGWFNDFDIAKHFIEDGANFINYMTNKVAKRKHKIKDDSRY